MTRPPHRFCVVAARFNEEVTDRLLESCLKTLEQAGMRRDRVVTVRVPGSYELPWAAQEAALAGKFDAVICIGTILKGETPQNSHIAASVFRHLHSVSLSTRVPVILGVIAPDTRERALARTRGELDRGREAALAALEMAELRRRRPWKL